MLAIRERPVQRYSEVCWFGAEGQSFVVEVDFQLTFSFLVGEMEDCRRAARANYCFLPLLYF